MNKDNSSQKTSQRAWEPLERKVLKKIMIRTVRNGGTIQEGLEHAAYRLERTVSSVKNHWQLNIFDDFKEAIRARRFGDAEVDVNKLIYKPKNTLQEQGVDWDELRKRAEETHVEIVSKRPAPDVRYIVPKAEPNASQDDVNAVIEANPIYREVREGTLNAQRRQVAYGLDKYPEPLNADTWTTIETIDHIISETQDKLHYLVMLKHKLQKEADAYAMGRDEE